MLSEARLLGFKSQEPPITKCVTLGRFHIPTLHFLNSWIEMIIIVYYLIGLFMRIKQGHPVYMKQLEQSLAPSKHCIFDSE